MVDNSDGDSELKVCGKKLMCGPFKPYELKCGNPAHHWILIMLNMQGT